MFLGRFFKRAGTRPGWLAVLTLPDRVDVAHIRHHLDARPRVLFCDSFRKGEGDVDTLRRLCKELEMKSYHCTALLNPGEYQLLLVEAPNVPEAELKGAMRWRIKDMLEYGAEEATIDMLNIPVAGDSRSRSVYVVAARNSTIRGCMQRFEEAGIPLAAIDVPELAQRNIASLFEPEGRGVAVLGLDDRDGLITFTFNGELFASRRIDVSLKRLLDPKAGAENRQQALDRIVLELQRLLDYADRQFSFISISKLLVPPVPKDIPLESHLGASLGLAVETFDLSAVMDISAVPLLQQPQRQIQWFNVLGAAMRNESRLR